MNWTIFLTVLFALWTRDYLRGIYRTMMEIRADNRASADEHARLSNMEYERAKARGDGYMSMAEFHGKLAGEYATSAKWFRLR
jgi:hypothetical protein